jgi:hypothetical protein
VRNLGEIYIRYESRIVSRIVSQNSTVVRRISTDKRLY